MTIERLPEHVVAHQLVNGLVGYYWVRPAWAAPKHARSTDDGKRRGAVRGGRICPLKSQPLGTDRESALLKAEPLNARFERWRLGLGEELAKGSVAWLFDWYRRQPEFTSLRAGTRRAYIFIMDAVASMPMRVGSFGDRRAGAIDAEVAYNLYQRRRTGRERQAAYEIAVCRRVWGLAMQHASATGVALSANPFQAIRLRTRPLKGNRPTSRAEYQLYRAKAREMGLQSMAVAAALAFECCQRVWDVFGFVDEDATIERGIKWRDYVPGVSLSLIQSKTGNSVSIPLCEVIERREEDGRVVQETVLLYPELEEELARTPRHDDGVIVRDERTGLPYSIDYMPKVHHRIRRAAGLPAGMSFTGFRHGGITELGDAGVEDVRPISGHRTLAVTAIYNKINSSKARKIAVRRRQHIALATSAVASISSGTRRS